jgi:hypothetical protein
MAFHDKPERYIYLNSAVENLLNYPNVSITIQTNTYEAKKKIESLFCQVSVDLYDDLENPLYLTWKHRDYISKKISEYDFFMYTEDDILLPLECFENYVNNFQILWPKYVPSFIRIEVDRQGVFYNSDAISQTSLKNALILQNKKFICLDNPYHGFWIFPSFVIKENLEDFKAITKEKKFIREIAASYGLKNGKHPAAAWKPSLMNKKGLVEMDGLKVSKLCYSYHLPNNYVCSEGKFGKIQVKNLIDGTFL